MQNPLYKKPEDVDLSKESDQKEFVKETLSSQELMQKELDVNQANQILLNKRILLMEENLNNIPSSNPQYSDMAIQIQMDNIELDELKLRQIKLEEEIKKQKQS